MIQCAGSRALCGSRKPPKFGRIKAVAPALEPPFPAAFISPRALGGHDVITTAKELRGGTVMKKPVGGTHM